MVKHSTAGGASLRGLQTELPNQFSSHGAFYPMAFLKKEK
jgi:hypothetical protein